MNERTVLITQNLDATSAEPLLEDLTHLIAGGTDRIVCDFSACEYISSIGVGVLISAFKRIQKLGGTLVLTSLKPKVKAVFETAGLLQILPIV